jgi:hypothetical protein
MKAGSPDEELPAIGSIAFACMENRPCVFAGKEKGMKKAPFRL